MNKYIVQLGCFVAGGAIGVLCTRSYFKTKYEQIANDEIESVKRAFRYRPDIMMPDDEPKEEKKEDESFKSSLNYGDLEVHHVNYSDVIENLDDAEYEKGPVSTGISDYIPLKEAYDEEKRLEAESEHPREDGEPYLIDGNAFNDEYIQYSKVFATYYAGDDVIADDITHDLIDISDVGYSNLEFLKSSDAEIIYIRNDNLGCDIELSYDRRKIVDAGVPVYG